MVTRRRVVLMLGAGTFVPAATLAQQRKMWRIGLLREAAQSDHIRRINAFKTGMTALGYAEDKDYVIEIRTADSNRDRLPLLADELVKMKVDVIFAAETVSAIAASKATRDIPILIATVGDPVGTGLAASIARPGGNVTGLTSLNTELISKRLDLLRQLVPKMQRVGLLYNPSDPNELIALARFELDCNKLKLQAIRAPMRNADELVAAFSSLARSKAQGLVVTTSPTFGPMRQTILEQAAKLRLPATYGRLDFAEAGGLMAYATDFADLWRRTAAYADKIFKGVKPDNLPIEQPMLFDFAVNLKTAAALGIKVPGTILIQANKVIE